MILSLFILVIKYRFKILRLRRDLILSTDVRLTDQHVKSVHEGRKPLKFEGFMRWPISILNQHVTSVHEKRKPFKCEVWGWISFQKGILTKHIKSVHEVNKPCATLIF